MGVDYTSVPPLPCPTESESYTAPPTPTEIPPSDSSQVADDESHYSLPNDGTAVTIRTRGHRAHRSQTSLLIEYFEGSSTAASGSRMSERKPSVRVRLTPSTTRGNNDRIQVTETRSSRRASQSRRAATSSIAPRSELEMMDPDDAHSMRSYASATEESNVSHNPIEVDIDPGTGSSRRRRKVSSPLIPAADAKSSGNFPSNASDISAIPTDSFLDGSGPNSTGRDEPLSYSAVSAPAGTSSDKANRKQRSEYYDQNASQKSSKTERRHRSKSRVSATSERDADYRNTSRRRPSRNPKESIISGAEPSVLSSQLTPTHRSYDSHSSSKISINNPKLLETVEDAIRRLILPELDAIKRERSLRETKGGKDPESMEDVGVADKRMSVDTTKSTKSRDREARNDLSRQNSNEQFSSPEDAHEDSTTPRRSHDVLADTAAAATAGAAALQSKARSDEKRQRRRRRTETPKREQGENLEDEDATHEVAPPMPLSSEINPSEITRTSILSADTDRPQSASDQMMPVREVSRGVGSMDPNDGGPTPTRSPVNTLQKMGSQHANVSHGDLRALPRKGPLQYVEGDDHDAYGASYPPGEEGYGDGYGDADHLDEHEMYEDEHNFYGSQDVPEPLRYIPYQQERRGLSPIQSVSGYTEGESDIQGYRDSRLAPTASELSSPSKTPQYDRDLRPQDSLLSDAGGRGFDYDANSAMSSGLGYKTTVFTDDSELGPVTSAQAVKLIEGNPRMVHQNFGPESAVASLIDPSMVSQDFRDSQLAYPGNTAESHSRGISPTRRSVRPTDPAVSSPAPSGDHDDHRFSEYELNEYGQKVPQSTHRQSPTTSETAITSAALSRAAALKRQNEETESIDDELSSIDFGTVGITRDRSFKARAKNGYQPDATPRHSVDRLYDHGQPQMGASALPDFDDDEPALGYSYSDSLLSDRRTPSAMDERFDETHGWASQTTPTRDAMNDYDRATTPTANNNSTPRDGRSIGAVEAAAAATLAAAGAMAASHDRQSSEEPEEEWQRTSSDRKRDTLLTNPYEGTSPIANLPGIDGNMLSAAGYGAVDTSRGAFHTGSPGLGGADEGYISAAPNDTRDPTLHPQPLRTAEDPFYSPKDFRHGAMSQGMASPLYDPSTGTGIDRIQSKDIIALMEHLMVRDAQRTARDTEMLVTLVHSAAEMRNSFDDIKKLLAETEDTIVNEVNDNTEKTVKRHLGGPRPFPGSSARSIGGSQTGTEDLRAKKRNILRRALQGLSAKGNNDLGRIEDMLMQLLTDVDVLKHQTATTAGMSTRAHSIDNLRPETSYEQDRGYEPEGNAGTSTASHASQSGHLSIPQSRGPSTRLGNERKISDHRISTVQEDEGEYEQSMRSVGSRPSRERVLSPRDGQRGGSAPLGTPPQTAHGRHLSAASIENTPRTAESKKQKSKSSTFFPKISRWSETTASSIGKAFRNSGGSRKQDNAGDFMKQPPSRSGSDLADFDPYQPNDPYMDDKPHTDFSPPAMLPQGMNTRGTPTSNQRATAPMAYATPEDPKYRAHRDSLNLQHPQPRPGQTERFRTALETSAADYDSPMSPRSADWAGSVTSLHRFQQGNNNRYGGNNGTNTGTGGDEYAWEDASSPAPARPPKEPLDSHSQGAQSPSQEARLNKLAQNQSSPLPYQSVESGYGTGTATHMGSYHSGSPRPENKNLSGALGVPTRRPSGPRAMTPSRGEDGENSERRRKRDTFGSPSSALSQESETF